MKIITAEKRQDGYHWTIQTNDDDPESVIHRQWPNLPPLPDGETDTDRVAEYIEMQKRELQIEVDGFLDHPVAEPTPIVAAGGALAGKTVDTLVQAK